jgi:cbb3-type cytochrome oxidase maturation protein
VSAIVVLIGFSLTVATGFLIAFLWAVKSGQYDDKYTPSLRILFDEPKVPSSEETNKKNVDDVNPQSNNSINKKLNTNN